MIDPGSCATSLGNRAALLPSVPVGPTSSEIEMQEILKQGEGGSLFDTALSHRLRTGEVAEADAVLAKRAILFETC